MRLRALLATVVVAALAPVVLLAAPASAHDVLVSSDPAADASVPGDVDRVTLTLSEPPLSGLQTGIVISVTDAGGAERSTGDVRIDGNTIAKDVDLAAAGSYRVQWRSVSVDGHPISGEYRFTSTGATAAAPTTSASPDPAVTSAPTPTATAAAAPEASDEATAAAATPVDHSHHTVLLLIVALVIVGFAAVVGIRALRDRRNGVPADGAEVDGSADEHGPDR
ncbi:copper resistance CopC family protein [Curtobacterium caseinilyticum]|uniref:Copper resistance protein CopC n=1 Tax=Curtobacterium caseinilyticum TaxID=3055137 RepID=A0ABT7TUU0_9MICO|nr:copper resistance CopC family protein [Curtobacterium caseinilyticum]MDM7892667.1 copper resistance protein CopC [Curtobacterium caseinilyticum]